jgi:hypothetical protein
MASDLGPHTAISPAGRRFAVVPVGLKPTYSLSGHVLKNRKMDEIRLFLHTTAHRASQQMAGGHLRFSLRK